MNEEPLTLIFLGAACWVLGRLAPLIRAGKSRHQQPNAETAAMPPMSASRSERLLPQAQIHGAETRAAAGL